MLASQLPASECAVVAVLKAELFRNVSGFTGVNTKLNVALDLLDAAFASLLIHLPEITEAEKCENNSALLQYTHRFHSALQEANDQLGAQLTMTSCCEWGVMLKSSWQLRNHLHVGRASAEKQFIIEAAITQSLALVSSLRDSVTQLQAGQKLLQASHDEMMQMLRSSTVGVAAQVATPIAAPAVITPAIVPVAASLARVFFNWRVMRLWEVAEGKKKQNARSEMKSCIKIMKILYQDWLVVPDEPPKRDAAQHNDWEQQIWMIGKRLDEVANGRLRKIDKKKTTNRANSLRKRWKKIEIDYPDHFAALNRSL